MCLSMPIKRALRHTSNSDNFYFNDKNYIIFAGENKVGMLKYKLMEFYLSKPIKKMGKMERE